MTILQFHTHIEIIHTQQIGDGVRHMCANGMHGITYTNILSNKPNRMSDAENCLFTPIYGSVRVAREKWRK